MATLFNDNPYDEGYRLQYMELFNWGTFHGKVYRMEPTGNSSLLTGANGSGKTTLVDALLTLLVPTGKRFYNQSSGAESKKERDELSYFWGFYGKTFSDAEDRSKTEQLRHKSDNPYSVLLACFENKAANYTITLVQVRWFSAGTLKKVFIVSPHRLNINDHFGKGNFDMKGEWKKRLVRQFPRTDLFDSFKEYSMRFSELFGLKEKALSLFNQTVGIKVLGELTEFIRQHMLEEPDAEEQFKQLYDHYQDLLVSHKAIQKDEKQLELLEPIVTSKDSLNDLKRQQGVLRLIDDELPPYMDRTESELLEKQIGASQVLSVLQSDKKKEVERDIEVLERERDELIGQKTGLNIDNQIASLQITITNETEKRDSKMQLQLQYSKLAGNIGLIANPTEDEFGENKKKGEELRGSLSEEFERLQEERVNRYNEQRAMEAKIKDVQDDLDSYVKRKNRIPPDRIEVRRQLLNLLETGEDELPFVGELIKVNEDSGHWEDAIERVLHGFALQLLVPQRYTKAVNQYVNSNNLNTRLVYQRINDRERDTLLRWPDAEDYLVNKIELKESPAYGQWVKHQLLERFNYFCTDDLDIFYKSERAVTSKGLVRNVARHEKDDRPNRWSKLSYVLGWDNKETIRLLMQEKHHLEGEYSRLSGLLDKIRPRIRKIEEQQSAVLLFLQAASYSEINWQQHASKIEMMQRQIQELSSSNDQYQTILHQLKEKEQVLKERRRESEGLSGRIFALEGQINDMARRREQLQPGRLSAEGEKAILEFIESEDQKIRTPTELQQFDGWKREISEIFRRRLTSMNKAVNEAELKLITLINGFVRPDEKTLKEFPDWTGDILNISPDLGSLEELADLHQTIRNQRLVEHKRRFREYMDKSMLDALTSYRTWLNNEEDKIKEVIEELNVLLKKIVFNRNPDTYLQLECRPNRAPEIKIFKSQLSESIPNVLEFATQKEEGYRESVFEKIKGLIQELHQEEAWRRKVTDVRNWLVFSAREFDIADNRPGKYHENTASYSGGEKAQFTYAVLGAAIAHQFGIFQEGRHHRSLRFITVDEAFSKLDPEKSKFLMEFCDQLSLQIMVVTPFDKVNIVEPYIHSVHFVDIKDKRHSVVYNLTMEEYFERKEEFKQLAENEQ